jgi:hypothetical protein
VKKLVATLVPLLLALAGAPSVATAASDASPVVNVRTVPAVSGISLTFEGRRYVTDSAGRALIPRARDIPSIKLLPRITVGSRRLDAHTIVRFARWFTVGSESVAAFDIFRQVGWRFVDGRGAPVPTDRIERVVLRSTSGEVRVLRADLARPRWLFSRRVRLIGGQPVLKDVDYAVQRVTVLGADVVNAGQQTFSPEQERTVRLTLAFFTLTVRGEDALFGSSVGTRARLELPDGTVRNLTLVHGRAVVPSLPRGNYRITLEDGGYALAQPLVLSRSQVAVVPVVTYLDFVVVGGGLLALAIGLVLVGRPYLARRAGARIAARGRAPSPEKGPS